jgi:hypothetical protein
VKFFIDKIRYPNTQLIAVVLQSSLKSTTLGGAYLEKGPIVGFFSCPLSLHPYN